MKYDAIACPASWKAVSFLAFSLNLCDFFSVPSSTRDSASTIPEFETAFLPRLTARSAASFIRFSRSAPVNPIVSIATSCKSTSGASGLFFECTLRISSLPFASGRLTVICLSNLPGLKRAGSSTSGLFVAAITITPVLLPKPSISTRS